MGVKSGISGTFLNIEGWGGLTGGDHGYHLIWKPIYGDGGSANIGRLIFVDDQDFGV